MPSWATSSRWRMAPTWLTSLSNVARVDSAAGPQPTLHALVYYFSSFVSISPPFLAKSDQRPPSS